MNSPRAAGPSAFDATRLEFAYPAGIEGHFWNRARHEIVRRKLAGTASSGVVLDVGCGRGETVAFLRDAGYDCKGVELAPVDLPAGLRPHVAPGTEAASLSVDLRRRVVTITLLDVLEHLDDPVATLRSARAAFPGLRDVVVTVPARAELWSNYDDFYGHRRRYDADSLRELLAALGPAQVEAGYFFHLLYPVMRLQAAFGATRRVELRAPGWPAVHRLLAAVLSLEERLVPRSWPGTSLWATARLLPA